ncbi:MAG: outer membrane beta-barrel protein [Planctomycetia bacterium]|nr:outer membrane beta-barrel protein [Planctomycetia bacterium]
MKKIRHFAPALCLALFGSAAAFGANLDSLDGASSGARVASAQAAPNGVYAPYANNGYNYNPSSPYTSSYPYSSYGQEVMPQYGAYPEATYEEGEKWLSGSIVGSWLDGYLRAGDAAHMDQVWLTAERVAHGERGYLDWGYRVDALFGTTLAQSTGDGGFDAKWGVSGDGYGASIYQGYAQVGYGMLSAKIGKFATIVGYEPVDNSLCPVNTHTYMFGHEPCTHTGGLFTFAPSEQLSLDVGLVSGVDCSFDNRRGDTGFLFGATLQLAENFKIAYAGNLNQVHSKLGEDRASLSYGYYDLGGVSIGDQNEYLQSVTVEAQFTDKLGYAFQTNYGTMEDRATNTHRYTQLGFANYLTYQVTDQLMAVARYEYFTHELDDEQFGRAGDDKIEGKIHDVTLGLVYRPTPNLFIRPDVRYDWVDQNGKDDGFTGAVGCGLTF